MNSEERFRKSLQEMLNSRDFSFDEDNWEKAKEMIDAVKKPKRRLAPLAMAASFLLVSLLTGVYFLWNTPSSGPEEKLASHTNTVTESMPASASVKDPVTETPAAKPLQSIQRPEISIPKEEPQAKPLTPAASVNEIASTPKEIIAATPEKEVVKVPAADPVIKAVKAPEQNDTKALPEKSIPVKEQIVVEAPVNVAEKAPENSLVGTKAPDSENKLIEPVVAATLSSDSPQQQIPEDVKQSPERFASDGNPPVQTNEAPVAKSKSVQAAPDLPIAKAEEPVIEKIEAPVVTMAQDSTKNILTPTADLLPPDNDQGQLGKPKEYPVLISIEAGTNYLYGWQNPVKRDASGFNPLIGINYFNNFKPKMSLSIGLHYTTISNLNYSTYTSKIVRLGFGEESKVTVFTPTKVHYLIVPLRFNYNVNAMNTIGIGCNIAYLMTVESDVDSYTEKLNTIYDRTLTKTKGYTEGFKKYDTQLSAFYKRRFYPVLAMQVEMFYGLTDIKDNKLFNSNVFERNMGMKLTLVYNFLKK